jgi:alpha-tubulin suppressor-like RCC1 family protein
VTGVEDAVQVETGDSHTCVRLDDGTVACWGENQDGQLGGGQNPLE